MIRTREVETYLILCVGAESKMEKWDRKSKTNDDHRRVVIVNPC